MSDSVLGILKSCLLVLLYLFLLRVVLVVASELKGTPLLGEPDDNARGVRDTRVGHPPEPGNSSPVGRAAPQMTKQSAWKLTVIDPPQTRGTTTRVDEEITIGRGGGCAISVPTDTFVSTVHARVYQHDDELWVEDLHSTNGTLVNDTPVTVPTQLKSDDKIAVGSTVLVVSR